MTHDHHLARQAERHLEEAGADRESVFYEGRWYRAGDLFDRAARIAGGLRELGIEPGDRVVGVLANSPDVGLLYQAAWRAGAVATPAMFLLPPTELRHIITDAEARAVVVSPEFLGNVQAAAEDLDVRIIVDAAGDHGHPSLEDLAGSEPSPVVDREDDDLAALMYTGGTTGRSKGVMLTHANLWHAGRSGFEAANEDGLKRTLVPLPLAHAFGLLVTAIGMHNEPDHVSVLMRWFDPAGTLALVEEHRLDQATLVPTMLKLLLTQPLEHRDLSSWRRVVSGSAPLPAGTRDAFEQRVPSVTVCEGYGLTETTAATTTDRRSRRREGTVGQALPGIEIRIVDDEGDDVPAGEPGEVVVGSRTVSPGYWRAPRATEETFFDDPDGRPGMRWCRTGDIGSLDEDGYLSILDRKKDLIIRGGFNIYPRDVEDALHEHPDVATAGVVGRPDDTYGEEIVAFVTPQSGAELDPEAVRSWAQERLGPKSYPREIRVIEALPLTPVMKVDRKQLRTLI
jgi:long-chain acyl-CoA synthetase